MPGAQKGEPLYQPAKIVDIHAQNDDCVSDIEDEATSNHDDYRGNIEVEADWWNQSLLGGDDNYESDEDYVDGAPQERITGIVVTNNSYRPIKALAKIMTVYSSGKGRKEGKESHDEGNFAETVGENGVGLKQGCAVLSDLSFVLVHRGDVGGDGNGASKFSMGIIAKKLQRPEGLCLPSVEFDSNDLNSLEEEMLSLFSGTDVGECVARYGKSPFVADNESDVDQPSGSKGTSTKSNSAQSLAAGVKRLILHFRQMSGKRNGGWGHFSEVFRVVLHDVKGSSASNSYSRALALMDEIESTLPSTYIHIPDNLDISVNGREIQFNHYQSRLVEFTEFYRRIDPCRPVGETKSWREENNGYAIRLLFGFDATRVEEKQAEPRLLFHSRHSGRLVKSEEDCRKYLNLPSGSSDFCHGLTVIVDDMHGHLPLNPTKQNIAFAEGTGEVHETNLKSWISAYTHLFYKIHLDLKFGGSKAALGAGISRIYSQMKCSNWDGPSRLDNCLFTQYAKQEPNDKGIIWKYFKTAKNIRCGNVKLVSEIIKVGRHTCWRFDDFPEVQNESNVVSSCPSSTPRTKKRKLTKLSGPDYKKLYEELKMEHEGLKEEHEGLKKDHQDLNKRYQEKGDYKKKAKRLQKVLDIERNMKDEELKEKDDELKEKDAELQKKDERIKKSEAKYKRLKEEMKSIG